MFMTKLITKTLHFERFKNLMNWSVAGIIARAISYNQKYELVSIGSFLDRNKNIIVIDDNTIYTQITLKINNGGVVERGKKRGSDIGTKKQTIVRQGQFLFSKIDARNGAFGIIPEGLDGSIVTNDFPVFEIDKTRINPTFLLLVTTTESFLKFAQSCSSGTTNRQRIDVIKFLQQRIPLPTIEEQESIVSEYNSKIQEASDLEDEATKLNDLIDIYVTTILGVKEEHDEKIKKKRKDIFLHYIKFKDILRWDVYNETSIGNIEKFNSIKLSNIIVSKPQYGAGYSSCKYNGDFRYIRITDINEDGSLNEEKVSANDFSEKYLLQENDFLIARSGNTVGKTFLYRKDYGKSIFAGYLIRFKLDQTKINPDYLLAYTKSTVYKKWITGNMRVSAQPNINSKQYLDSPIILPPLDVQAEIVNHVNKQRGIIKNLKQKAQALREEALKEFENKIFE